jgi:hypothetical protein
MGMDLIRIRAFIPFLFLMIGFVSNLSGCREDAPPPEMVTSHEDFLDALRSRDPVALYDLSCSELHERMETLHTRLGRVEVWLAIPENEPWAVRLQDALMRPALKDVTSARDLFVAIADFHSIDFDGSLSEGLQIATVEFDGEKAMVRTLDRETFSYDRDEEGVWKSRFALDALDMWPGYHVLKSNLTLVEGMIAKTEGTSSP